MLALLIKIFNNVIVVIIIILKEQGNLSQRRLFKELQEKLIKFLLQWRMLEKLILDSTAKEPKNLYWDLLRKWLAHLKIKY